MGQLVSEGEANRKKGIMRECHTRYTTYIEPGRTRKYYGFWNFLGDIVMVGLTGGLWLIWIFVREMRRR